MIAVNDSQSSLKKMSRVSNKKTAVFHFRVTGGPPNGWTYIKYTVKWPGGSKETCYIVNKQNKRYKYLDGDTDYQGFYWSKPTKNDKGIMTVKFYNSNGKYLG